MPWISLEKIDDKVSNGERPAEYAAEYRERAEKEKDGRIWLSRKSQDEMLLKWRQALPTPPPTQPAAKKKDEATPPSTPAQFALAERRAALCGSCEQVKRSRSGEPRLRLMVDGVAVCRVWCEACGCSGLSLIEGECPLGYWASAGALERASD